MTETTHDSFLGQFDLLAKHGVVGVFDHFELIELVQYEKRGNQAANVFTLAVAMENGDALETHFLNKKRIKVEGLADYSFGICRSVRKVADIRNALDLYLKTGDWRPGSVCVGVGRLKPTSKCFSPPNSSLQHPLNRVLKNNFFAGSYTLELFDPSKDSQFHFEQSPSALQSLSQQVAGFVPVEIASLSDRIGNIVLQFPVEAIRVDFRTDGAKFEAEIAWHPDIAERKLIVTAAADHDRTIVSYDQKEVQSGLISLGADPDVGTLNGTVWDPENRIILSATGELSFIKQMSLNMAVGIHEPRMIPTSIKDNAASVRIKLSSEPTLSNVGHDLNSSIAEPIRKRSYADELAALGRQRKFVQYAAQRRSGTSDRERAMHDVRSLIAAHGAYGVWLWDPFLAPQDLLDTLFHNPTSGASMRALTALRTYRESGCEQPPLLRSIGSHKRLRVVNLSNYKSGYRASAPTTDLTSSYRSTLSNLPGNLLGLCIEYRSAHGPRGWDFHDRFLIFPKSRDNPAKAWSLGTSVNSLGKSHHILQQADNAQLIADAFQALWTAVDHPHNLIWKCHDGRSA